MRSGVLQLGAATLAFAGCTTTTPVPFCGPPESLPPAADPACLEDPAVADYRERLSEVIEDDAGKVLFRVGFDQNARVEAVCAERAPVREYWAARHDVAERLEEADPLPQGPDCLAGTRLDLNEFRARQIDIAQALGACGVEAEVGRAYTPGEVGADHCVRRIQRKRGEIWLLEPPGRTIQVYEKKQGAAPRRDAIEACIEERLHRGVRVDAPLLWIERTAPCIDACMREHGWRSVSNPKQEQEKCTDLPTAS